jgi:hypothetical protein
LAFLLIFVDAAKDYVETKKPRIPETQLEEQHEETDTVAAVATTNSFFFIGKG